MKVQYDRRSYGEVARRSVMMSQVISCIND